MTSLYDYITVLERGWNEMHWRFFWNPVNACIFLTCLAYVFNASVCEILK